MTPASSPPAPHPGGGERADAREEAKLSLLIDMGFTDEDENRRCAPRMPCGGEVCCAGRPMH